MQTLPRDWELRTGIPAREACHQFVSVMYDQEEHETSFSRFSIALFEVAVKLIPYHLPYDLIPFDGTYDKTVVAVYKKVHIVT